jgi:hypothetical protein
MIRDRINKMNKTTKGKLGMKQLRCKLASVLFRYPPARAHSFLVSILLIL